MKHLVFVAIFSGFLSACGGDGSSSGNTSPPGAPVQSENPVPTPVPECGDCEPAQASARLPLTDREIDVIHTELRRTAQTRNWDSFTQQEKETLAGAWLYEATENVKPINWEETNDEDLSYLIKLFFTEDLKLKDN